MASDDDDCGNFFDLNAEISLKDILEGNFAHFRILDLVLNSSILRRFREPLLYELVTGKRRGCSELKEAQRNGPGRWKEGWKT